MYTSNTALEWELHAPGTHITFSAARDEGRYDLVMRRDDAIVFADVANDAATLFQKSSRLRSHLQQLGYSARPEARRDTIGGGICWGPAQPLALSLLDVLR